MQLAADFVDGFFDGAVLERGEMRTSRGRGSDFEGVILHLIVNVLDDPYSRGHQVNIAVAVFLAGGRLRDARLRRQRKRARRSDLRPRVFRLGLQFGASRGKSDAVNGDVSQLRLPQDLPELGFAARVGSFGKDHQHATAAGLIRSGLRMPESISTPRA